MQATGKQDLLKVVRKYPVGDSDPFENFLTEAWCWVLNNVEGISAKYLSWFFDDDAAESKIGSSGSDVEWLTQQTVWEGTSPVFLDLVAVPRDSKKDWVAVFEHKAWSPFSRTGGEWQLSRYERIVLKQRQPRPWGLEDGARLLLGAVTATAASPDALQLGDARTARAKTWAQVYQFLDSHGKPATDDLVAGFVVNSFMHLLQEERLVDIKAVDLNSLHSYFAAREVDEDLKRLLGIAAAKVEWRRFQDVFPGLRNPDPVPEVRSRYGRVGLDLVGEPNDADGSWCPGIFLGVMLDGKDHGVDPSNAKVGPDFCLIVSVDRRYWRGTKGTPLYAQMLTYRRFQERLREVGTHARPSFELHDHLASPRKGKNLWHPLHLRVPLSVLLQGRVELEAQADGIAQMMTSLLEGLLRREDELSSPLLDLREELRLFRESPV